MLSFFAHQSGLSASGALTETYVESFRRDLQQQAGQIEHQLERQSAFASYNPSARPRLDQGSPYPSLPCQGIVPRTKDSSCG